jgi:hypothetical protein
MKVNYRKIYEQYHGSIPNDEEGRTYDIHHIDGNRKNNDPNNLVALSIKDHYNIHYKQKDWAACHRLATKMKMSPNVISELSKEAQNDRISKGTHHFIGGEIQRKTMTGKPKSKKHRQNLEHMYDSRRKKYEVIFPDGEVNIIKGLRRFCSEQNLNIGCMNKVLSGIYENHKGYVIRRVL